MKATIKLVILFYFLSLTCISLLALNKCATQPESLFNEVHCPFFKEEIQQVNNLVNVKDSLAPYYKYLDEMGPDLVNLLVLNGYLSLVAILITVLYYALKLQSIIVKISVGGIIILALIITLSYLVTDNQQTIELVGKIRRIVESLKK